jgi:hypothetical protein
MRRLLLAAAVLLPAAAGAEDRIIAVGEGRVTTAVVTIVYADGTATTTKVDAGKLVMINCEGGGPTPPGGGGPAPNPPPTAGWRGDLKTALDAVDVDEKERKHHKLAGAFEGLAKEVREGQVGDLIRAGAIRNTNQLAELVINPALSAVLGDLSPWKDVLGAVSRGMHELSPGGSLSGDAARIAVADALDEVGKAIGAVAPSTTPEEERFLSGFFATIWPAILRAIITALLAHLNLPGGG